MRRHGNLGQDDRDGVEKDKDKVGKFQDEYQYSQVPLPIQVVWRSPRHRRQGPETFTSQVYIRFEHSTWCSCKVADFIQKVYLSQLL